ncbi:hypothetical protein D0Y65_054313 [Glycine soja]|uniref:CAAX prenyl protease 2/Lysostaphin resistance protein A-like domain-containing protein n=1 Tax=Glycine soja TaxID=3848 RepID=A0A445F5W7_GLYSO|nr:hypothetical protein D0Y65_054313 [Glycine soja]
MGGDDGGRRREVAGWCGLQQMMNERIDFVRELLNSVSEIKLEEEEVRRAPMLALPKLLASRHQQPPKEKKKTQGRRASKPNREVDQILGMSPNKLSTWKLYSRRRKMAETDVITVIRGVEPWTVPWTAKTIVQVMLLWIASFWFVGSWIVPFLAYTAGFRKESLTYRGQALCSLLTDVAEGVVGIAILRHCLAKFQPLSSDWFKFEVKGKWQFDVGLGCLMFPLINQLSQMNLNLLPVLQYTPVTISSVEQSIVARDPVAMALYAVVVSVCAPIWEEIVFRGFLLPSLTKYMPVWSAILVSSIAFALAHFNIQRMLPLVFLGMVMGTVFVRSRNLFPSMLLHSLWNAFVFLDLMK